LKKYCQYSISTVCAFAVTLIESDSAAAATVANIFLIDRSSRRKLGA
jgi:hypothetical protein